MTRKELCRIIINDFQHSYAKETNGRFCPPSELQRHISKSSSLAVALEHLGLISDERCLEYAKTRAGVALIGDGTDHKKNFNKENIQIMTLSYREILELLPE